MAQETSDIIYDADLVLRASSAIDANENGDGKKIGPTEIIKAVVRVTAKSGTNPTLDIHFEESDDDSDYTDIPGGAMAQITDVGDYIIYLKTQKKYVRHVAAVGGTSPSFTTEIFVTTAP